MNRAIVITGANSGIGLALTNPCLRWETVSPRLIGSWSIALVALIIFLKRDALKPQVQ